MPEAEAVSDRATDMEGATQLAVKNLKKFEALAITVEGEQRKIATPNQDHDHQSQHHPSNEYN